MDDNPVHENRDDKPVGRRPVARFGPDRRLTALCAAGVLVGIVLVLTWPDTPGRLLFGLASLALAGYVVTDLIFWPRLLVDADGMTVHAPFAHARWSWPEIDHVRADARQRYGLRSVTLEIDAGDQLVVLSRRALGEAPELVAERVAAFAPPRH